MLHWKDDGSRAHRDARNSHSVNGRKEEGRTESDGGEGTGGGERPAERASENTNGTVLDASALGNGEWLADALEAVCKCCLFPCAIAYNFGLQGGTRG